MLRAFFCHLRGDEHERWVDAALMLSHRPRLWADIELALARRHCRCWASSIDGEPVLSKRPVLLDEVHVKAGRLCCRFKNCCFLDLA